MTLSDKMAGGAAVDAAPRRAAARQKPVWTATLSLLVALWVPAFALAIWFIRSRGSDSPYFPPLSDILAVIPRDFIEGDHFFTDVLPSMGVVLAGLALASVIDPRRARATATQMLMTAASTMTSALGV